MMSFCQGVVSVYESLSFAKEDIDMLQADHIANCSLMKPALAERPFT